MEIPELEFQQFVKQDGNGFEYMDRKAIVAYLNTKPDIQARESQQDGLHVTIGAFQIWQCRKGFAVAALMGGSYIGHHYFEHSPEGLKQAIEHCFKTENTLMGIIEK